RRITLNNAMSITPCSPDANARERLRTWVKSQWKLVDRPGQFSMQINKTIDRLGLNNQALVQLRKAAIEATLQIRGRGPASIGIADARRRLRDLEQAEQQAGTLEPYSFVLVQALERQIQRIEKIRESKGQP
ncbi:MAG: hypothetical protein O9306_09520, partial [Beijerinckiaceae bacterium]|nr:hypothetical protein [Beijerinckiaceae bacterium]